MSTLIFDTETTGLVNFKLPDNDPSQPRLVQLGMMVLSDKWEVMHEVGVIIKSSGFPIPDVVANIHGITYDKALRFGIPLKAALSFFSELVLQCDVVVAHNIRFDRAVIISELARMGMYQMLCAKEYCTMLATQPILCLPQSRGNGYKWPKLSEAYEYFFGEPLLDAHDALTDVRACARIYKHLMTVGMIPQVSAPQPTSCAVHSDCVKMIPKQSDPSMHDNQRVNPLYEKFMKLKWEGTLNNTVPEHSDGTLFQGPIGNRLDGANSSTE